MAALEKILVIGDTSFYGRNFIGLLNERGYRYGTMSLREIQRSKLRRATHVVNFAAANLVAQSWDDPAEYARANVVQTTMLIEELSRLPIKRYLHASTPEVYGNRSDWIEEGDTNFNPSTPYAVTRAAADMMVLAYHKAMGFPGIITRTANIYGPGQQKHRIIPATFEAIRTGKKLQLEGGGLSLRGFIHVKDACEATLLALLKGKPGRTYHIAPMTVSTIAKLVKDICELEGAKYSKVVKRVPDRLGKDECYKLECWALPSLGWQQNISLELGLVDYARSLDQR